MSIPMPFDDCDAFLASLNEANGPKGSNAGAKANSQTAEIFSVYNNIGGIASQPNDILFQNFAGTSANFTGLPDLSLDDLDSEQLNGYVSPDSFSSNVSSSPDAHDARYSKNSSRAAPDPHHGYQVSARADELESINEMLMDSRYRAAPSANVKAESEPEANQINRVSIYGDGVPQKAPNKRHSSANNVMIKIKPLGAVQHHSAKITKPKKEKSSHNMIEKRYRTNINDKIKLLRDCVPSLKVLTVDSGDESCVQLDGLQPAKKLNKATILSKATEYIKHLETKNEQLLEENKKLKGSLSEHQMSRHPSLTSANNSPLHQTSPTRSSVSYYSNSNTNANTSISANNNVSSNNLRQNKSLHTPNSLGNKILVGSLACVVGSGALDDLAAHNGSSKSLMALPMVVYNNGGLDFPTKLFTTLGKISLLAICIGYILDFDFWFFKELFEALIICVPSAGGKISAGAQPTFARYYADFVRRWILRLLTKTSSKVPQIAQNTLEKEVAGDFSDCKLDQIPDNGSCKTKKLLLSLAESTLYLPSSNNTFEKNATIQFNKSLLARILTFNRNSVLKKLGTRVAQYYYNSSKKLLAKGDLRTNTTTLISKYSFGETIGNDAYISRLHQRIYSSGNIKNSSSTPIELLSTWKSKEFLDDILYLLLESLFKVEEGAKVNNFIKLQIERASSIAPVGSIESLKLSLISTLFDTNDANIQASFNLLKTFSQYGPQELACAKHEYININYTFLVSAIIVKSLLTANTSSEFKLEMLETVLKEFKHLDVQNSQQLELDLLGITGLATIVTTLKQFIFNNGAIATNKTCGDQMNTALVLLLTQVENFSGICRVWIGSTHDSFADDLDLRTLLIQQFVNLNIDVNEHLSDIDLINEAGDDNTDGYVEEKCYPDSDVDCDANSELTVVSEHLYLGRY